MNNPNNKKDTTMKQVNYQNLYRKYAAYQIAFNTHNSKPDDKENQAHLRQTLHSLMEQLRYTLWDEAPWGQKPDLLTGDELPF